MEILVCIKQVPDDSVEVHLDPESGQPAIDQIAKVVNAFDTYALEMAARLKEAAGGEITVVSIGSEKAKDALKNCLSVGASNAYLVSDGAFDGSDTLGISEILSAAIHKIEEEREKKFDLIFCGKETTDFTSSQVGPQLAEKRNIAIVTEVIDVMTEGNTLLVKQETEDGYCMLKTAVPCVLAVTKPEYDPRYPTIKSKMAARKIPIPVWNASDLTEMDWEKIGDRHACIQVLRTFEPPKKQAGIKIKEETSADSAIKAVLMMAEAKVL